MAFLYAPLNGNLVVKLSRIQRKNANPVLYAYFVRKFQSCTVWKNKKFTYIYVLSLKKYFVKSSLAKSCFHEIFAKSVLC